MKLMFVAGEASGDGHAAAVIAALRRQAPAVEVFGAGGPRMAAAGMELVLDLTEHAVVGLVEVLKNYGKFRRFLHELVAVAEQRQPAAVVLVDFPGFNLRLASALRARGLRVIYYISPQLWAWHAGRARQIERDVELMLTIFPFEKEWYARHAPRLAVEFVGHPLLDRVEVPESATVRDERLVLLLPGSREAEVRRIFPVMARVVDELPGYEFVAVAASASLAPLIRHSRVRVATGNAVEWMRRATLALTASGTATMECAVCGCPMIVIYRVNWLTYWVGRAVVQVNWLAMPNVLAGREVVPEFIQHRARPRMIAETARGLLTNPARREQMQGELANVVAGLGGKGAAERAAALILDRVR
ncbi:MAG: lipid-A-disaccharide synthase [Verrucomicrobiae bacterium]|nr:lipid-A-disaccharide synthase [Verrucomicrobiae bacterium]